MEISVPTKEQRVKTTLGKLQKVYLDGQELEEAMAGRIGDLRGAIEGTDREQAIYRAEVTIRRMNAVLDALRGGAS